MAWLHNACPACAVLMVSIVGPLPLACSPERRALRSPWHSRNKTLASRAEVWTCQLSRERKCWLVLVGEACWQLSAPSVAPLMHPAAPSSQVPATHLIMAGQHCCAFRQHSSTYKPSLTPLSLDFAMCKTTLSNTAAEHYTRVEAGKSQENLQTEGYGTWYSSNTELWDLSLGYRQYSAEGTQAPHSSGLVADSLWLCRSSGLLSAVGSPVASLKAIRM